MDVGEGLFSYGKCYMAFINIPMVQFMCFNGQLHDFYCKEASASMNPVSATLTIVLTIGIAVFLVAEVCVGTRSLQNDGCQILVCMHIYPIIFYK